GGVPHPTADRLRQGDFLMWFSIPSRSVRPRRRPPVTPFRPRLELLEDRRLLSAGALDPTFDGDGTVRTDFGYNLDAAFAVAVQPDGKVVAAGKRGTASGPTDFAVARYNADGSLDTTFDGDGKVFTNFGT